jgi:hypothetical protein
MNRQFVHEDSRVTRPEHGCEGRDAAPLHALRRLRACHPFALTRHALLCLFWSSFALLASLRVDPAPAAAEAPARAVYVVGAASEDELTAATVNLASARPDAVVLIDSAKAARVNEQFLAAFKPTEVVPVGRFADDLEQRLGVKPAAAVAWHTLFPRADRVVVCPARPRRLFLHAAALAGVMRVPLFVLNGGDGDPAELQRRLADWKTDEVVAVGKAANLFPAISSVRVVTLADEAAVSAACVKQLARAGPIENLVLANAADIADGLGPSSALAPWIAAQKRAALLLTNEKGDDASDLLRAAVRAKDLEEADAVVIVGGLKAVPMEKRMNPAPGKDTDIEMEPGTPKGEEPFPFSTGRLFNEDPALVAIMLARRRLLAAQEGKPRKALVVGNAGGGLPLLETFSRNTTSELRNNGYETTALFGEGVDKDRMRKLLPEQDLFVWEGHYRTLIDDFGFLNWTEPLQPSLCFLQSCLALKEDEADPLWRRGAVAVVGSSTRIYSATGGSFTLAYFDAMLYDDLSLGGSLRQAKNFLLAYSRLKDKRLGDNAKLAGANLRSAWAFSLWGDPTLKPPHPPRPTKQLTPVTHAVKDNALTVSLPETPYDKVMVGKFEARMLPNARLAGLLTVSPVDEDGRVMVPFVFAEVRLPQAPPGHTPRLTGRIPERNWVFCWDARRRAGYLLVTPRGRDQRELRFRIEWDKVER